MELDLAPPMLTCILGQSFGIRIAIRWVWVWGTFLTVFAVCFLVAESACAVEGGRYAASAEKDKKTTFSDYNLPCMFINFNCYSLCFIILVVTVHLPHFPLLRYKNPEEHKCVPQDALFFPLSVFQVRFVKNRRGRNKRIPKMLVLSFAGELYLIISLSVAASAVWQFSIAPSYPVYDSLLSSKFLSQHNTQ